MSQNTIQEGSPFGADISQKYSYDLDEVRQVHPRLSNGGENEEIPSGSRSTPKKSPKLPHPPQKYPSLTNIHPKTTRPSLTALPRKSTLEAIAIDCKLTVEELRLANPQLKDYGDKDEIPLAVEVATPHRSTSQCSLEALCRSNSSPSKADFNKRCRPTVQELCINRNFTLAELQESNPLLRGLDPDCVVPVGMRVIFPRGCGKFEHDNPFQAGANKRVTFLAIAESRGLSCDDLIAANPLLAYYGPSDPIPAGILVKIPPREADPSIIVAIRELPHEEHSQRCAALAEWSSFVLQAQNEKKTLQLKVLQHKTEEAWRKRLMELADLDTWNSDSDVFPAVSFFEGDLMTSNESTKIPTTEFERSLLRTVLSVLETEELDSQDEFCPSGAAFAKVLGRTSAAEQTLEVQSSSETTKMNEFATSIKVERQRLVASQIEILSALCLRKARLKMIEQKVGGMVVDLSTQRCQMMNELQLLESQKKQFSIFRDEQNGRLDVEREAQGEHFVLTRWLSDQLLQSLSAAHSHRWAHQVRMAAGSLVGDSSLTGSFNSPTKIFREPLETLETSRASCRRERKDSTSRCIFMECSEPTLFDYLPPRKVKQSASRAAKIEDFDLSFSLRRATHIGFGPLTRGNGLIRLKLHQHGVSRVNFIYDCQTDLSADTAPNTGCRRKADRGSIQPSIHLFAVHEVQPPHSFLSLGDVSMPSIIPEGATVTAVAKVFLPMGICSQLPLSLEVDVDSHSLLLRNNAGEVECRDGTWAAMGLKAPASSLCLGMSLVASGSFIEIE